MPKIAGTKKSQDRKPKSDDVKMAGGGGHDAASAANPPWETSLMEVYGTTVSLSYPRMESGALTKSYVLSPSEVPLQEGFTVKPDTALGQVSVYDDGKTGTRSVIFNAAGGEVRFAPPNLNGVDVKGDLAVTTLVREDSLDAAPQAPEDTPVMDAIPLPALDQAGLEPRPPAAAPELNQIPLPPLDAMALEGEGPLPEQMPGAGITEASASLAKPLVIQPMPGFQMELGDLSFSKRKNDPNPKLRFYKTKLTYQDQSVAPDFETESDNSGLHLPGSLPLPLDGNALAAKGFAGARGPNPELELQLDQAGARITEWAAAQEPPIAAEEPQAEAQEPPAAAEEAAVEAEEPQNEEFDEAPLNEEEAEEEEEEAEGNPDLFTDDGFLQLEHPRYDARYDGNDPRATHGIGAFRFLSIPYDITTPKLWRGGTASRLTGVTQELEGQEDTDFVISADGKLDAVFPDPVELPMEKGAFESDAVIKTLTLMDAAIAHNILTAKRVRMDRGLQLEQDLEDDDGGGILGDARKLFGSSLKGTIADVEGSVAVNPGTGITGETGRKQLGAFEVSDFLGFLDVSGDYAAGRFHAGLHSETKDEGEQTKHLFGESKHLTDAGLSIPLAGPLSFEFSVGTALELGGELSADVARNPPKSFGEEMEPNETLALEGGLELKGSASVSVSAGLAVGVSALIANLLSADLKLTGELGAEFQTKLTGGTALGLENEKLRQAEDLKLQGDLGVTLKGALSLSSDVKFLIWQANIFTLELAQKEIALARVSGTVTRDAGAKGLKNGWHFDALELSAEAFGKKAGLALKNQGEAKREPVRISKAAVDALGRDAMDTWAVLEDLKQQQALSEERLYFMSGQERKELNERIKRVSKDAGDKLREYASYLASYHTQLGQDKKRAEEAIVEARRRQDEYQQKDEVRGLLLRQSKIGGFDPENYRNAPERAPLSEEEMAAIREKNTTLRANSLINTENRNREKSNKEVREKNRQLNKMGAVDLAIARQLGIYDDAMAQVRDAYDVFAEEKNLELKAKDRNIPEEKLYRKSGSMAEYKFLFDKSIAGWGGTTEQMLEALTRFGSGSHNYYHSLYANAINESDGRDLKGFGFYHKAFRTGPGNKDAFTNMSGYDLLKIILTDTYPKGAHDFDGNDRSGQKMGGTPEQKLEALTHLFKNKEKKTIDSLLSRLLLDYEQKKSRQEAMLEDTNDVYKALFDSTLEKMTDKGNVNIPRKLEELKENLEESKKAYLQTIQDELDVEATMKKVEAERADCLSKLDQLKKNVKAGVALDAESVAGATGAVDFMERDYEEIVSGKRLLDAASENAKAQQALRRGGATG